MARWGSLDQLFTSNHIKSVVYVNDTDTATSCDPTPLNEAKAIGLYVSIVQVTVGVLNITMSLLIFFQRKYQMIPAYMPMRCFYFCNMLLVFCEIIRLLINAPYIQDPSLPSVNNKTSLVNLWSIMLLYQMMSNGMLILLALTPLLYLSFPYKMEDIAYATKLLMSGILITLVASVAITIWNRISIHENNLPNVDIYSLVAICIVLLINFCTIFQEKGMCTRKTMIPSAFLTQLYWFEILSSGLFIIASLPYQVSIIVKSSQPQNNCADKKDLEVLSYWFGHLQFWNYCMDNMVYHILSSEYRKELKSVMKMIISGEYPGEREFIIHECYPTDDDELEDGENSTIPDTNTFTQSEDGEISTMNKPNATNDHQADVTTIDLEQG